MGVLRFATRPAFLAIVLILIFVLVVALAILLLIAVLIAVLILVLVVHLEIPPFFYLRLYRVDSLPRFSGFILGLKDQAD